MNNLKLLTILSLLLCNLCVADNLDSDSDGLTDFQEIHKYLTDPNKKDTDGDGISDCNFNERREYTYTIRTVLRFMPPFDKAALNDNFQDARVLNKTDGYIELEVIHHPFSTAEDLIEENPNWQIDYALMTEYLKPGITANWDQKMKEDIIAQLKADGIEIDKLTDKQVVKYVSKWLMDNSKFLDKVFATYYIHFPDGKAEVYPGLEENFEYEFSRDSQSYSWSIDEHLKYELYGKGMFYNKTHGSCTSFAIYLTAVLRALGIPTRMIIAVPVVDPTDEEQVQIVKETITHNKVRHTILAGFERSTNGFVAHTYNEVYIGNRWHRLNYNKLGQPILDRHLFGMHTHLYTFNDLSEANLAPTWGWRYAKEQKNEIFKYGNPYTAISVSELFGLHSNIPNPPVQKSAGKNSNLKPNIYVMSPSGFAGWWNEFIKIVKNTTTNKTGRNHIKKDYDEVFIDNVWGRKAGDIVVLLFTLDTKDRIPEEYSDLLPEAWPKIEMDLKQGETVELTSYARDMNVILLAAPTKEKLSQLIKETQLLKFSSSR